MSSNNNNNHNNHNNHDKVPQNFLRGWTALVIDDDPVSLEIAGDVLTHYGALVETAVDGVEGLARAVELLPDFIIADIRMPGMDGWEMIGRMKENLKTKDIPVIALTAHAMKGDREKAIAAGFHYHLSKPLDPLTFMSQVLVFLKETRSQEMAARLNQGSVEREGAVG